MSGHKRSHWFLTKPSLQHCFQNKLILNYLGFSPSFRNVIAQWQEYDGQFISVKIRRERRRVKGLGTLFYFLLKDIPWHVLCEQITTMLLVLRRQKDWFFPVFYVSAHVFNLSHSCNSQVFELWPEQYHFTLGKILIPACRKSLPPCLLIQHLSKEKN